MSRWKPEVNDIYYFVSTSGTVECILRGYSTFDSNLYNAGNCFQTKEKAEVAAAKIKALFLSLHEEPENAELFEKTEEADLPDWCEVGGWVWSQDDGYGKITVVREDPPTCFVHFNGGGGDFDPESFKRLKQARLRPYNEEEMKSLVGRIVTSVKGDVCLCTDYDAGLGEVCIYGDWFSNTELLNSVWQINDMHCGVFEHLNEDGEWVN